MQIKHLPTSDPSFFLFGFLCFYYFYFPSLIFVRLSLPFQAKTPDQFFAVISDGISLCKILDLVRIHP
jgi:hypothetical protein